MRLIRGGLCLTSNSIRIIKQTYYREPIKIIWEFVRFVRIWGFVKVPESYPPASTKHKN